MDDVFYQISFSFSIVVSLVALFFNLIIILIVIIHPTHHTVTNILHCNTSIIIFIYFVNNLIVSIYGLREEWALNQPLCFVRAYWFTVSCISISYSYFIQALSRLFFAVFYKHRFLLTFRMHWLLIVFNWIIGLGLATQPFFYTNAFIYERESRLCTLTTKIFLTSIFGIFLGFVVPLTSSIVIYLIIWFRARKSSRRIVAITTNSTRPDFVPNAKREMTLTRNMMLLINIFAGGGTPYLITVVWNAIASSNNTMSKPPEFLYLVIINLNALCIGLMASALFFLNKPIRHIGLNYIRGR